MEQQLLDLIQRSRAGDRQAQEKLVGEAQNRVYYHCKKMLKNEEDALDATQDVLLAMLTGLDKLREPAAFWGWVNGITANRCKHLLTQGTKEWQIPEDEEGNSLLDEVEDLDDQVVPDRALDSAETQRLMAGIIDALPPEQKMSVLFFYYDEMSVKEIAAAMEVSEGTVKSRLNYARKAIKDGVERLAKKGTKLYGISPLPFLAYFLRMGAQSQVLSPTAAAALTQGTLASLGTAAATGTATGATAAAGTSAAGASAAAGTAATGASTTAGAAGAVSTNVVAAVLAGIITVGGIGTAAYRSAHQEPEPTPSPTPAAVMAVVTLSPTPEPTPTPEATEAPTPTPEPTEAPTPTPEPTEGTIPTDDDFVIENGVLVRYKGPGGNVVIPDGVTAIGESVFTLKGLTGVTIPRGVTAIGRHAFNQCDELTEVSLPDGLTVIGRGAFMHCDALTHLSFPNSLTTIESQAFFLCGSLNGVILPDSLTTIGDGAFSRCDKLTSITIPDSVTKLGKNVFLECKALHEVKIGSGVTVLDNSVFSSCDSLASVIIPGTVSTIGVQAFSSCASLREVTIGDGVTKINNSAFIWNRSLTKVTVPSTVTYIDTTAFGSCLGLTFYGFSGSTAESYAEEEDIPFVALDAPEPTPTPEPEEFVIKDGALIEYNGPGGRVVVPDGVTVIGNETLYDSGVFDNRSDITEVILPSSVTTIARYCFANSGLTSITIPESVTAIYGVAFDGCQNLTDVYFLSSSTGFDGRMWNDGYLDPFQNCPNLTIHAPAGSIAEAFAQSYNIPFEST